jgi:hypothetical protein
MYAPNVTLIEAAASLSLDGEIFTEDVSGDEIWT